MTRLPGNQHTHPTAACPMAGYSTRRIGDSTIVISADLDGAMQDRQWQELCDDLFAGRGGTVVKKGAYKTILACSIAGTACLVKVYTTPGIVRLARSLFAPSRAGREFTAARYILSRRIPAPRALFMAERRRLGCVTQSIVGIEYLSGARELRDLLFEKNALTRSERTGLARDFGRLTALIFARDVFQYDLSLSNILARREPDGMQLYLIDYERVDAGRALSPDEKLMLLSKLNRVGCEVRVSDRLRFLQGYCAGGAPPEQGLHVLARDVQRHTVRHLQRDLQRGRLTSLYTHGEYVRILRPGMSGLMRKGYAEQEVLSQLDKRLAGAPAPAELSASFAGQERRLRCVWLPQGGAARIWAVCSAFRIAGLPLELPHAFAEGAGQGMLLVPENWIDTLRRLLAQPSKVCAFLKEYFPGAWTDLCLL